MARITTTILLRTTNISIGVWSALTVGVVCGTTATTTKTWRIVTIAITNSWVYDGGWSESWGREVLFTTTVVKAVGWGRNAGLLTIVFSCIIFPLPTTDRARHADRLKA